MSTSTPSAEAEREKWIAVAFAPTVEEWAKYYQFIAAQQRAVLSRSRTNTWRRLAWVLGLAVLMIVMQTSLGYVRDPELRVRGSGMVSGLIFWGFVLAIFTWIGAAWRRIRHRGVDSTHVHYIRDGVVDADLRTRDVRFDSNGLRIEGAMGLQEYPWSEVQRVIVQDEMLMIFVSTHRAVFVPRRAFASESQFEDAYDIVLKRMGRASDAERGR